MTKEDENQSPSPTEVFYQDVISGLSAKQKSIPSKYLYDEFGSSLFDDICELEEYYLTRTEQSIIQENAALISEQLDRNIVLVELGSGSSTKTRTLLDALVDPVAYVPVDISETHLLDTAKQLRVAYPNLEVLPVVADFTEPFEIPTPERAYTHIALFFPGSTIGNFESDDASNLLGQMAKMLGKHGGLLIGIDLQKDESQVLAAYNDAKGVTSRFSLNLLARINRELDGDFNQENFRHKAVYNSVKHRVDISIQSLKAQTVSVRDHKFEFEAEEEILTEYSHKYTVEGFAKMAGEHGFSLHQHWTDEHKLFGLLHLVLDG